MSAGLTSSQMALRDPDIRLMLRVRDADDSAAFAELVGRFQHRLVAVMQHLIGDPAEAEDLAQEAFLRVYRSRAKYHPTAKFSTWLFAVAHNLALNARRDRKRRPVLPQQGPGEGGSAEAAAPDRPDNAPSHHLRQLELAAAVRRALDTLNERQRAAVVLSKFEDMPYAEIGAVLGMSAKAVKSLLARARVQLRDALKGYVGLDGGPPVEDER
ncbi:MAG: sigma-70 family RNA polymerase sigma factor [Gemmataceae bacterium]|nr:sigma-70 family RNA polymerase sigma factor [Gemmataceae bacterium]